MLQILLMILKILGIIVLVVLGIILTVLLLVLFVPVRYRIDGAYDEKPSGEVLVSWLLHLVTVRVAYDGAVKALVKILWFRLFDRTLWPSEDENEAETEPESDVYEEDFFEENVAAPVKAKEEPVKSKQEVSAGGENRASSTVQPAAQKRTSEKSLKVEVPPTAKTEPESQKNEEPKTPLPEKIRMLYANVCEKTANIREKLEQVRSFLADHENQETIRLLFQQVKKLFIHVLPRKISGRVRFGFEDPATTGQILMYISPFYGLYAKTLSIEPVFDEKVLDGNLQVKGHIRVVSLLWFAIRVFLNKNFRKLLKQFTSKGKK